MLSFVFNINSLYSLLTFTLWSNVQCDNQILNSFPQEFCPKNWVTSLFSNSVSKLGPEANEGPSVASPWSTVEYSWPLNKWTLEHCMILHVWGFFKSKYCSSTKLVVDWICGYGTLNTGEPCIEKADCKLGFLGGWDSKESAFNEGDSGDLGSIPRLGRSPGEGNDYPLQDSWLENSTVYRVAKSWTQQIFNDVEDLCPNLTCCSRVNCILFIT